VSKAPVRDNGINSIEVTDKLWDAVQPTSRHQSCTMVRQAFPPELEGDVASNATLEKSLFKAFASTQSVIRMSNLRLLDNGRTH